MSDPADGVDRFDPWTREGFTVTWSGGPLLGPRPSRTADPEWSPAKRLYSKGKAPSPKHVEVDDTSDDEIDQKFVTVFGEDEDNE